jgi:hypothetical protein
MSFIVDDMSFCLLTDSVGLTFCNVAVSRVSHLLRFGYAHVGAQRHSSPSAVQSETFL